MQIRVLDSDDFVERVQSDHLAPAPMSADGVRSKPHVWRAAHETSDQPLFLHESTARALGLVPGDVPDLVDSVLGTGQLKGQRQKVRGLVMRPPPPGVAADISAAIRCESPVHCAAPAVGVCIHMRVSLNSGTRSRSGIGLFGCCTASCVVACWRKQ